MRLFAAIEFPDDVKRRLLEIQSDMRRLGVRGNYTKEDNFHITLAFIGEWSDPEQVICALDKIAFNRFEVALSGLGKFDALWWVGVSRTEELSSLALSVRDALGKAGIPYDKKKFSPHITLIRKPSSGALPEIDFPSIRISVGKVSLMRSDRAPDGVKYTRIASFNCKE
ncbi:MAG: RNA 2',3'-cyclic phosphodiesterase [Clostridia bacterium]|nr:RNA 2',3'-cyclic phosphodiesterase [Clostridia bacterium]